VNGHTSAQSPFFFTCRATVRAPIAFLWPWQLLQKHFSLTTGLCLLGGMVYPQEPEAHDNDNFFLFLKECHTVFDSLSCAQQYQKNKECGRQLLKKDIFMGFLVNHPHMIHSNLSSQFNFARFLWLVGERPSLCCTVLRSFVCHSIYSPLDSLTWRVYPC
jgi:hypothetical protein